MMFPVPVPVPQELPAHLVELIAELERPDSPLEPHPNFSITLIERPPFPPFFRPPNRAVETAA